MKFKKTRSFIIETDYESKYEKRGIMPNDTPGNLVRSSRRFCTHNLYANFRPLLTRSPNVNKRVSSPGLLNFSQFHRHIWKNPTMLFPTTFISASEKIGVFKKKKKKKKKIKKAANFSFNFTRRWGSSIFLFWPFFQRKKKKKVFSAIWAMKYLFTVIYQIRRTATYVYVEIHKMLNFASIFFRMRIVNAQMSMHTHAVYSGHLLSSMYLQRPGDSVSRRRRHWLDCINMQADLGLCRPHLRYHIDPKDLTNRHRQTVQTQIRRRRTRRLIRIYTVHHWSSSLSTSRTMDLF